MAEVTTTSESISLNGLSINKSSEPIFTLVQIIDGVTTFTKFCDLPIELRRKIWKAALPTGQEVKLHTSQSRVSPGAYTVPPKIPTIFHVNRESREEAIKTFIILPSSYYKHTVKVGNEERLDRPCLIIPENDIISVDFMSLFDNELVSLMKKLVKENPEGVKKIKELHVKNLYWGRLRTIGVRVTDAKVPAFLPDFLYDDGDPAKGLKESALKEFSGLKKLVVHPGPLLQVMECACEASSQLLLMPAGAVLKSIGKNIEFPPKAKCKQILECKETLKMVFQLEKKLDKECSVPEIVFSS